MFLFLTALSPRGLGQRWHGEVATRSILVARAPPHLSTAALSRARSVPAGQEHPRDPVQGGDTQGGQGDGSVWAQPL